MKRKTGKRLSIAGLAVWIAAALLAGCGGGGGGGESTTTPLTTTVVDGALQNATVCLDKNGNGACDAGEPTGKTDVAGKVTLEVDTADMGKFPLLAVVGTDATDADTGAVAVAFTLKAPADRFAVVSPLTTLVQTLLEGSGLSVADAEAKVKADTGLNVSLFDDFTRAFNKADLLAPFARKLLNKKYPDAIVLAATERPVPNGRKLM